MAYYDAAWSAAVSANYVTDGTQKQSATKGWIIYEMGVKAGMFTVPSSGATSDYYAPAWQGALNAGIITEDISHAKDVPTKGWAIFVLSKIDGVITGTPAS